MSAVTYRPWSSGRFTVGVGLRSVSGAPVFLLDSQFDHYRQNKARVRTENLEKYYPQNVGLTESELAATVSHLSRIADSEGIAPATRLPGEPGFRDGFDEFCCRVQEDISIWKQDQGREWLAAIHLAAPNHWSPAEKIGRSFVDSHLPVPKIAPIAMIAGKLFQQGLERGVQERLAWGVATDNRLNHHPLPPNGVPLSDWHGRSFDPTSPKLFARVERQTLFPVPGHQLLVFTIRTFFVDVATLPAEEKLLIDACIGSMSEDILRYKGLAADRDAIRAWLRTTSSEDPGSPLEEQCPLAGRPVPREPLLLSSSASSSV